MVNSNIKNPSKLWYLLPIFLGIIGGLIMFYILKDENRNMAKNGFILSVILTIVGIALVIIVNLIVISTIGLVVYR